MRKWIIKLLWLLLNKVSKRKQTSDMLDKLIEVGILQNMTPTYKPSFHVLSGDFGFNIRKYQLVFTDNKELTFRIEYFSDELNFYFVSTDIVHISTLTMVLNTLDLLLKVSRSEITKCFIREIEQHQP